MAELLIERFTRLDPKGLVLAYEVVLIDNDARPLSDQTPRTTSMVRLMTRGDIGALPNGAKRDIVLTTGRTALRVVVQAERVQADHLDIDLSSLGLAWTLPRVRGTALPFDYYVGPAKGAAPPTPATTFDTYKSRGRA